jgi:hypothetical protein
MPSLGSSKPILTIVRSSIPSSRSKAIICRWPVSLKTGFPSSSEILVKGLQNSYLADANSDKLRLPGEEKGISRLPSVGEGPPCELDFPLKVFDFLNLVRIR